MGDWSISNGSVLNSEWTIYSSDDISNLNTHFSNCINTNTQNIPILNTKISSIYNLFGQNINGLTNGIFIYIYEDGSTEKKVIIK